MENFFWISIPKMISVSGNLLQIIKVWVYLKSAILKCSDVICRAVIGKPSIVFNFAVVGCIRVLKLSSMCWYVEYWRSEIAAPESIRALYLLLAWTVIFGQSMIHATVIVSSVFGPHSWGALLREGSTSLNGLSPLRNHLNGHLKCISPFVGHLL